MCHHYGWIRVQEVSGQMYIKLICTMRAKMILSGVSLGAACTIIKGRYVFKRLVGCAMSNLFSWLQQMRFSLCSHYGRICDQEVHHVKLAFMVVSMYFFNDPSFLLLNCRFNFTTPKLLFILALVHSVQFTFMAVMLFTKCPKQEIPSLELSPGPRTGLPQLQVK